MRTILLAAGTALAFLSATGQAQEATPAAFSRIASASPPNPAPITQARLPSRLMAEP